MKLKRLSENYNKDPPWFNRAIKSLIQEKKDTFKKYRKSKINIRLLQHLKLLPEKHFLEEALGVVSLNKTTTRECQPNLLNFIKVRKHTGPC